MSFLKSAVNQVGRDMGKVVSNQIFKDSHSTPYRKVGVSKVHLSNSRSSNSNVIAFDDFDKAMNFPTSHRPDTLISKTAGVYTVIKNLSNSYISDGYLDVDESDSLFNMMSRFNNKIADVCDVLELDEEKNEKQLDQLEKIVKKTQELFNEVLEVSAEGCELAAKNNLSNISEGVEMTKTNYILLHVMWCGKYARGERNLSIFLAVLANLLDLIFFTFFITRPYLLFKGFHSYSEKSRKTNKLNTLSSEMCELELQRAKTYRSMIRL